MKPRGSNTDQPTRSPLSARPRSTLSMHDGIAVWCDCCSCEMEPYWQEAVEKMGFELVSDYEDEVQDL